MALFTPTTLPSWVNSGPPELPWLIGASIWMNWSYGPAPMSRPLADTMPAVTVPPRPNGLPIATTHSPGLTDAESPSSMNGNFRSPASSFSTARSVRASRPMILAASSVPSSSVTVTDFAPFTTWLLVTTMPEASTMKPEPRASITRCCRSCGIGIMNGTGSSDVSASACILVVMETTAGFTWATRSAKSGIRASRTAGTIGAPAVATGVAAAWPGAPSIRPPSAVEASSRARNAARPARLTGEGEALVMGSP